MSAKLDLVDFPIQRGDTYRLDLVFNDEKGVTDMRSKTVVVTLKIDRVIADEDADIVVRVALEADDSFAQQGKAVAIIEKSKTSELIPFTTYFYAVRVEESGVKETFARTMVTGKLPVEDA